MSEQRQGMSFGPVHVTIHDAWAEVQLARPPVNALDPATVDALHDALDAVDAQAGVRGVLLRGVPKMFSAGLDVVALQPLDREEMRHFWNRFGALFTRLYGTSKVTVACIEGHAPAGGCVLAIACDHRVMAEGRYKIGLNEVAVGLAVPSWLTGVYAGLLGRRVAERALQLGQMMSPERALEVGLVDEIAPVEQVFERSVAELQLRLGVPDGARRITKAALRAGASAAIDHDREHHMDALLDVWFSDECRSVMAALIQRLKGG